MRKSLFHVTQENTVQFVTFRTQASVAHYLEKHNIRIIEKKAKQQFDLDQYLDNSPVGAMLNGELVTLLIDFLKSKNDIEYKLFAVSIMPNHIHLLFQQIRPLASTMHRIKGASAYIINQHCKRSGMLWDKSYFDKVVRDEKQFQMTYQYIKDNAYKANLVDANHRFYGVYEDE